MEDYIELMGDVCVIADGCMGCGESDLVYDFWFKPVGASVCNRVIHRWSVCFHCAVVHLGLDSRPAMVRWVMGCSEKC